MSANSRERVSVDKARLVKLLERQLRYRWLADESIVTEAVRGLFGRRHAVQKQFVREVVAASHAGLLSERIRIRPWLRRNPSIKRVFAKNETIWLPESLADRVEQDLGYRWDVPQIDNLEQLSQFLSLRSQRAIDWLTLPHCRSETQVNHYRQTWVKKRDGTKRWIEQPAPTLKRVQRIIARELLPNIPLHKAACAFRSGMNIMDCAKSHVERSIVFRIDLKDYFPTVSASRVRSLFLLAGYPLPVARSLSWICTSPAENAIEKDAIFRNSRLPQGAPTSPGIANAVSFSMDRRLAALSDATDVTYTRYADDMIFSSDKFNLAMAKRFATTVSVIAMEEGFQVNFRKTHYMRHGSRQRVLGLIVNEKINSPRGEYERLKAILHNCIKNGIESENRDAHPNFVESLRGRISHIASVNSNRGAKLMEQFAKLQTQN